MPSQQDWITTVCPQCKTSQTFFAYKVADAGEEPEVREKLFKGALNVFKCVSCQAPLHYDEYLIYADREKGLLVNLLAPDYKKTEDALVKRIFDEILPLPVEDALPNFIVYGYKNLAQILGLMERRLQDMPAAERESLAAGDYQRMFSDMESGLLLRALPDYEKKYPEAEALFRDAGVFLQQKNMEEARKIYEQALAVLPDFFEANLNLGLLFFNELDNADKAMPFFEKCCALRPNDGELHFGLGQIHLKRKEVGKALACFYRALILSPASSLAWFNLGLGLAMQGNKEEGVEMLEKSLALTGNEDNRSIIARTIRSVSEKM